jgi:hypothetical protein
MMMGVPFLHPCIHRFSFAFTNPDMMTPRPSAVHDMRSVLASLPPGSRFLEDGENVRMK